MCGLLIDTTISIIQATIPDITFTFNHEESSIQMARHLLNPFHHDLLS